MTRTFRDAPSSLVRAPYKYSGVRRVPHGQFNFLTLRYKNTVAHVDADHPFTSMSGEDLMPEELQKNGVFYPLFCHVLREHHEISGQNTSGYPDKMMFMHPRARRLWETLKSAQRLLSEGKTPWMYSTRELEDILAGCEDVLDDNDQFQQSGRDYHGGNAPLKQLWGQCDSLGPDVGITTNLDMVLILIRYPAKPAHEDVLEPDGHRQSSRLNPPPLPKKAESGFIVSPLMRWDDPRLITCLIGLCYMAIDEDVWGVTVQEMICPEVVEDPVRHRLRRAR